SWVLILPCHGSGISLGPSGRARSADEHERDDGQDNSHTDHGGREGQDLAPLSAHGPGLGGVIAGASVRERTNLAGISSALFRNHVESAAESDPRPAPGGRMSARLTNRESTMTLRVRTTNDSAPMRSTTRSKCCASAARMCSRASASPVIVHAPVTSGYLLTAAPMSAGDVRPRQNSST